MDGNQLTQDEHKELTDGLNAYASECWKRSKEFGERAITSKGVHGAETPEFKQGHEQALRWQKLGDGANKFVFLIDDGLKRDPAWSLRWQKLRALAGLAGITMPIDEWAGN
jgi:hypothetical protein